MMLEGGLRKLASAIGRRAPIQPDTPCRLAWWRETRLSPSARGASAPKDLVRPQVVAVSDILEECHADTELRGSALAARQPDGHGCWFTACRRACPDIRSPFGFARPPRSSRHAARRTGSCS